MTPLDEAWDQAKDAAAEAVHLAWMATKLSHGFADHPLTPYNGDPTSVFCAKSGCILGRYKHHTDMIPFAELSDEIKAYDYATALAVFKLGYEAGYDEGAEDVRQEWWSSV